MTSAVSVFGHKSEFDSFLFAPVGEEGNGVMARYWMIAFYFLMTFVLMFAERFAEDRSTPASTKELAHSGETAPSQKTELNPVGGP